MKKKLTLILAALLVCVMAFAMTACGGGNGGGGNSGGGNSGKKGDVADIGDFTVVVPSGWAKFDSTDPFGEQDDKGNYPVKTDQCYLVKGGKTDLDVLTKPCLTITYYPDQDVDLQYESLSWFVDGMTDIDYSINGVACKAVETKSEDLFEEGKYNISYYIFLPLSKGCVSFNFSGDELKPDDADVKAILESVEVKGAEAKPADTEKETTKAAETTAAETTAAEKSDSKPAGLNLVSDDTQFVIEVAGMYQVYKLDGRKIVGLFEYMDLGDEATAQAAVSSYDPNSNDESLKGIIGVKAVGTFLELEFDSSYYSTLDLDSLEAVFGDSKVTK